jgi:hypothetical protein
VLEPIRQPQVVFSFISDLFSLPVLFLRTNSPGVARDLSSRNPPRAIYSRVFCSFVPGRLPAAALAVLEATFILKLRHSLPEVKLPFVDRGYRKYLSLLCSSSSTETSGYYPFTGYLRKIEKYGIQS